MDNNSMFLNKITEWFKSHGLPYITDFEAMLILLTAVLILLIVLWLVLRRVRLWYWKTDIQLQTLKSIDDRLRSVEEKLMPNALANVDKTEGQSSDLDEAEQSDTESQKALHEFAGLTAVGRSGKIYTEAELESQIRE